MHGTASTKMSIGQFREFSGAVLRSLPDDLDEIIAQGWIENQESLRKVLREALAPNGKPVAFVDYPISINYGLSLEEMITVGRYDWKNNDITEKRFPVKGEGVVDVDIQLVHFDRVMDSSDEVIRELDKMGLRPAKIEELLAFGVKFPDIQRQFPIVALGSVWRIAGGGRYVPYLGGRGTGRYLGLYWFEGGWGGIYRFAAVRK